ncbi:MAG TPA: SpoIIE family protein phosphatase [Humisphaera sp.]|nr:SpoIIE family protein phosphatase [Humisphaera sp.]
MTASDVPSLVVRDATGEIMRVPFTDDRLIVGRSPQARVRLDHALVSRQHAELWRGEDGKYCVRDLKSRNGTVVNGEALADARVLGSGDQVGIGPFVLTILDRIATTLPLTATKIVLTDGMEGRISTLKDHAPPQIDVSHLTTLNEFSKKLHATSMAEERAQLLCKLMVGPQFRAHWGAIVRIARAGEERAELICESNGGRSGRDPYLSRGVLRKVRDTGEAVLASNSGFPTEQENDIQVSISPQVVAMAAIACPVAQTDAVIEVLYVVLPPVLGSVEWLALVNLAVKQYQQAESAWLARKQAETMAAMERELARARQIQMRLVPKSPQFDGLDVAIGFIPCHWVGGDYVDAVKMADGRTLLAIADVCGKGLPAALVASSVHTMIHAGVLSGLGLPELMNHLNTYLIDTLPEESFVTMIAIAVDPASGEIEMVNAGHPPLLVLSPGDAPRRIEMDGNLPLGMQRDPIVNCRFTLENEEMAALYSDGLSELSGADNVMLGIEGLCAELAAVYPTRETGARAAAEHLTGRLNAMQGGRASTDDRTFLLARRQ